MRRTFLLYFLIQNLHFCFQANLFAQSKETIKIENLRQHMDSIASDATEGRFTGSVGYKKAADYAANVFKNAGLSTILTNETGDKSYFQPVPFIRKKYDSSTYIKICKDGKVKTFVHATNNFVILNAGIQYRNIPMTSPVFIGYGIHEPEHGWDDYSGLDVTGKWVILLSGAPPVDSNKNVFSEHLQKKYADNRICDSLKYNALIKHNVAGVIILPDKHTTENWEIEALRKYRFNYIHYANTDLDIKVPPENVLPYILFNPGLAHDLMKDQIYDPTSGKGDYHSFILNNTEIKVNIECKKEIINCYNIIAVVSGTDSSLKNEYITIGAHLDHLGKIGNHVYNGANDDASGCVILLEAAKAIAMHPLKRSVLFVLYTSEEQNLTGSKYFLRYPPIPIHQILLNINIEQIGFKSPDYPGIWVISPPEFKESYQRTISSFAETDFKFDLADKFEVALSNSDFWNYHQKNIPAIMLSSGGFKEWHTPQDKIDLIDFDHLLIASNFLFSFIVELGNR